MKYLIGDIGNTLTKITLLDDKFKIIKSKSIDSKKLYKKIYLSRFFKIFFTSKLNSKILHVYDGNYVGVNFDQIETIEKQGILKVSGILERSSVEIKCCHSC